MELHWADLNNQRLGMNLDGEGILKTKVDELREDENVYIAEDVAGRRRKVNSVFGRIA